MKQSYSFFWLLLPIFVLVALGASMFYERSGMEYEISYPPLQMLPQEQVDVETYFPDKSTDTLLLYDSEGFAGEEHVETVMETLDNLRVKYDTYDVASGATIRVRDYETIIIAFLEIGKLQQTLFTIIDYVEDGGKVLFSIRPEPSAYFSAIYRKLGMVSKSNDFISTEGIIFTSNVIPGVEGRSFGKDFIFSNSYAVELEDECKVHAITADVYEIPLLWECDFGEGRFVFINSDQFNNKSSRGVLAVAYTRLHEVFVYPVINSSVFFIDDFPGPIREGALELITEQYGRDVQSFLVNIWLRDLLQISRKYGIKYTGSLIETFNDEVVPPFSKQSDIERHQYFGGLIYENKGEIGLLGYNHVPLCLKEENINQASNYPGWPSTESMELAIFELFSFGKELFPDGEFSTYIAPSNTLCPTARQWLPMALPELQVISSYYLPDEDGVLFVQEFSESADGIVNFPRISFGYDPPSYVRWAAINELGLHYVNSHFFSPNDVLSDAETLQRGWETLRVEFEDYVSVIRETNPGLRNVTAKEGAMAVQRYSRMALKTELIEEGKLVISLGNFYDEAWLMLHSVNEPSLVEGKGEMIQVADEMYLIQALEEKITVQIRE
jgi:hypothetical protein